jgi:hypothetical protein
VLNFILEHWAIELALLIIGIASVYGAFHIHSVPVLRPISSAPAPLLDQRLRELNFEHIESCDACQ